MTPRADGQVSVSVLTQRYDAARSGVNPNETILTLSNVNANNFGKLFSLPVDGYVYAQPLYVPNVLIPGQGTHNVIYIATQHDSVYAYDADGLVLQPLWQVSLSAVSCPAGWTCTSVPTSAVGIPGASDVVPEVGVTSTPVIDPATGILYVVAKTQEVSGQTTNYVYRLHALDITTGNERPGSPVVVQGQVPGTGSPNSGGFLTFEPLFSLQRPGLALVNNAIYIAFSAWEDAGNWHGWIFAYDKSALSQTAAFSVTPNGNEGHGGIWMSGTGLAADASGYLYFSTGNGAFDGSSNFGDSYLKLATPGLTVADYFTPYNQQTLDSADNDVSAGGLTLLPDSAGTAQHPHIMIGCGKNGAIYVLDRDSLGHFNSSGDTQIIQELLNVIGSIHADPNSGTTVENCYTTGTYWQGHVYFGGVSDALKMFNFTNGLLSTSTVSQSTTVYNYPGTNPAVSANGATNGIVWAIESGGLDGNPESTRTAVLHAYDALNLANELYNTTQVASDSIGARVKFVVPTIANGKVFVGTQSSVAAYGLLSAMPQAGAPSFSPPSGTYNGAVLVTLTSSTAGATIYYTTDGSTPNSSSAVYSAPIPVSTSTVINAVAVAPGYRTSQVSRGTYVIGNGVAFVQGAYSTPPSPQSAVSVTYTAAQFAGDLNVIVVGWNDSTATVVAGGVTDTAGNVYILAAGPTVQSGTATQAIYYAKNIVAASAGANTVTVRFSTAANTADVRILEYSGLDTSSPVDVAAAAQGTSTTSSVSLATTNANDLLFGANLVQTTTSAPGSGFTSRMITSPDGDIAEDAIVTSTGNYAVSAQLSAAGKWIMQAVGFRLGSNFSLSASPSSLSITQGSSGMSTITVTPQNGFSGTVSLSASGLPSGVTASFSPASATSTSTLTLQVSGTGGTGTSLVTIIGTSGAVMSTVPINLTITAGSTWSISGTITDGAGVTVNLTGAVNAVTTTDGSGNYSFGSLTNGNYTVTPSGAGYAFFPASRQVTVSGANLPNVNFAAFSPVAHTQWSVVYVDSQETGCYNGAGSNAIDGKSSTMWVTQFCGATPGMPHEIQINLGTSYTLSAFQYLPRQDGCANGWIKQYAFYVSTDGVNWGTAVATGTFNYGTLSTTCPGGGVPAAIQVNFTPLTGQYIRLQALSEINGHPWTAVAEINVLASSPLAIASVNLNPAVVAGGNSSTGTVTLNRPAPVGGAVVTLSSSNTAVATVPENVTVLAGNNTATFTVTTNSVSSGTQITIGGSYNGNQSAMLTVTGLVSHTGWSVTYVDSQETACYNGAGTNAIDGNNSAMWVTQFCGATPPIPHEIRINLGASYILNAFQYLARQDGCANGWIKQYAFYVSMDGVNWGTAVATGTFNYGALATTCPGGGVPAAMQANFTPVTGQYIRLQALSEVNGHPWTAVAEINVLGAAVGGPLALASVSLNPAVVVGGNSSTGTVTLNGPAPAGGAVVTLSSSNTAVATVPASVTVLAGNNTATFTVMTVSVSSSTQATIGGSYNGNQSATLTINAGSLIPHTLWSVLHVDSQETGCYNGSGSNAIDGNSSSMWVTQFCASTPGMPHEIQINLGASYSLSAFQYLPRQDGCANGWIKQYAFYVSSDGANWGAAVATGTFDYGALSTACPGGGVPAAMQVSFTPVTGQYIRLQALSEINGHPWTAVAEINVLGQ